MLLLGLSTGAVGWTIWQLRIDAIHSVTSDSGNIAAVLANQLARSLQSIDSAFLEVTRLSKTLSIDDPPQYRNMFRRKIRDLLNQYLDQLPHIFNIVIADEHGQLVVSTAAWPTPDINVADRDYFPERACAH